MFKMFQIYYNINVQKYFERPLMCGAFLDMVDIPFCLKHITDQLNIKALQCSNATIVMCVFQRVFGVHVVAYCNEVGSPSVLHYRNHKS